MITIPDRPEPSKVVFYQNKTHVFTNLEWLLKLTKTIPKRHPKVSKMTSKVSRSCVMVGKKESNELLLKKRRPGGLRWLPGALGP